MQKQQQAPIPAPAKQEWKPVRNFKKKVSLTEDERIMVQAAADLMEHQGWIREELGNTLDLFSNHCAIGAIQAVGPDKPRTNQAYPTRGTLSDTVTRKLGFATGDSRGSVWQNADHADLYMFNDDSTKKKVVQFFRDVAEFAPHEED